MKIIKKFEDVHYPKRIYRGFKNIPRWFWGLGENGELYYNRDDDIDEGEYFLATQLNFPLNLSEMKRVVKEFEHLLVML